MRLLFASCHGYVDPSSGAAISARQLLELLAARGHDCRVLSTGVLDYQEETSLEAVLIGLKVPFRRSKAMLSRGGVSVFDLELGGVRVTLLPTNSSSHLRSPDAVESEILLEMAVQVLARFRPQMLLTYGGHPVSLEMMARARTGGVPVVFFLRNLSYLHPRPFADAAGILVASEFVRRLYSDRLGLSCTVLPSPLRLDQVVASNPQPRYVTFINPVPEKGVTVFARIAAELDHRRPDIPLMVVESRRKAETLANAGLDLSSLRNLHMMANTHDPRAFYGLSRVILMPSLWQEPFGRVAAEGLANGLPVLASDRGGLPETLGDAGFVLSLPERCTPTSGIVPTAEEMGLWLEIVERLWDDPAFEAQQRARAHESARRWDPDRIASEYEAFFYGIIKRGAEFTHSL